MSKEYTVIELKEFARNRNLSVSGTKAEIIMRLEQFDSDIWSKIAEENEHIQQEEEESTAGDDESGVSIQAKEIELLKKERDLLRREVELLRRIDNLQSRQSTPAGFAASNGAVSTTGNLSIRALGDLLSDFDGRDFWRWEQQVRLLRATYDLDEKSTRVLISSKLKERAASWFHSKAAHITMGVDLLLSEMKSMFDNRQSKLTLRKTFENRVWKSGEVFADYYHDKIILGNRVPIAEDELVDYLIDGLNDEQLRDQARIMRFKTTADIFEAFENVSLKSRKFEKSDTKTDKSNNISGSCKVDQKNIRCFNCNETGHMSARCPKPRRQPGSCFGCGAESHQLKDCPEKKTSQRGKCSATKENREATSTVHVDQPHHPPYMPSVAYTIKAVDQLEWLLNSVGGA